MLRADCFWYEDYVASFFGFLVWFVVVTPSVIPIQQCVPQLRTHTPYCRFLVSEMTLSSAVTTALAVRRSLLLLVVFLQAIWWLLFSESEEMGERALLLAFPGKSNRKTAICVMLMLTCGFMNWKAGCWRMLTGVFWEAGVVMCAAAELNGLKSSLGASNQSPWLLSTVRNGFSESRKPRAAAESLLLYSKCSFTVK